MHDEFERALSKALDSMDVPNLSNLLFDGKGEIELNRRLSIALDRAGYPSRVEFSVPQAKGSRTHSDIVIFNKSEHFPIACIECKSCITPDVFTMLPINNNFTRLRDDLLKYSAHLRLYAIMWTIHWNNMDGTVTTEFERFKYFSNHAGMRKIGFDLEEIMGNIVNTFSAVNLGKVIHQNIIESTDKWRNCQASVIATLSHYPVNNE